MPGVTWKFVRTGDHMNTIQIKMQQWAKNPCPLTLQGAVQHYAWGGTDFIPQLIGCENPQGKPFAELWLGDHPGAPALAEVEGEWFPLNQVVKAAPSIILGEESRARYGDKLPYLLKALDAKTMLSIQVHPSKKRAEQGYSRENAAGLPSESPERSYRDDNHKPEVHVALTGFWMLHGFRPLEEIADLLSRYPQFGAIMPDFGWRLGRSGSEPAARKELIHTLYAEVMTMPQLRVDDLLNPLLERLEAGPTPLQSDPDYWALLASRTFPLPDGHRDRGIFSIYLLNLLHLMPGEGTWQPAGILHAYLEGINIELMAGSDNVLRGGLTPKRVDVPELLATLDFSDGKPKILGRDSKKSGETCYRTNAKEFELSRIDLLSNTALLNIAFAGPDTLLVLDGDMTLTCANDQRHISRGGAVLIPYNFDYLIQAGKGGVKIFRAAVPPIKK